MRTNTDMTLYNRYVASGVEHYQRTPITGVAWQGGRGHSSAGNTQQEANQITVYIPSASRPDYLKPKVFEALADKSANWTLQAGDIIVKGLVSDTVTTDASTGTISPTELKAKYDDVLVISDVQTFDYSSVAMQHWQVTAK